MKLAKGHIGKRKIIIQFNLPLPEEERTILEEAFFKIVENLKLEPEEVEFTKTKPYKHQPKPKEELKKEEEIEEFDVKKAIEEVNKFNEELENMLKEFEDKK